MNSNFYITATNLNSFQRKLTSYFSTQTKKISNRQKNLGNQVLNKMTSVNKKNKVNIFYFLKNKKKNYNQIKKDLNVLNSKFKLYMGLKFKYTYSFTGAILNKLNNLQTKNRNLRNLLNMKTFINNLEQLNNFE